MTTGWTLAGHTLGTPNHSVPDALRLFSRAGLDAAEVIWQDGYLSGIPETDNQALLAEISAVSQELALPVIGLTPYMAGLNSVDETVRHRDIDRFRRSISDASILGARVVRVYAGEYTPERSAEHDALWDRLVASLTALAPYAQEHDVTLVVENHFNTMTMTAAETVALVADVAHPAVGILYDQANLTFTHSEEFPEAIELQRSFIRHVHAKDLVFVDRNRPFSASAVANVTGEQRSVRSRAIGDGELDWQGILAGLSAAGYSGTVSLEYEYRWHPQDLPQPEIGFRQSADHLREHLRSITATPREGSPS